MHSWNTYFHFILTFFKHWLSSIDERAWESAAERRGALASSSREDRTQKFLAPFHCFWSSKLELYRLERLISSSSKSEKRANELSKMSEMLRNADCCLIARNNHWNLIFRSAEIYASRWCMNKTYIQWGRNGFYLGEDRNFFCLFIGGLQLIFSKSYYCFPKI